MAFWIQGLFFQNAMRLDVQHRSETEGGIGAMLFETFSQYMYHGAIWQDRDSAEPRLVGSLEDHFGTSELSNIERDDRHFAFTKRYESRDDEIRYMFDERQGLTWIGRWSGKAVGNGISRCLITEIPDEFFTPDSIRYALSRSDS